MCRRWAQRWVLVVWQMHMPGALHTVLQCTNSGNKLLPQAGLDRDLFDNSDSWRCSQQRMLGQCSGLTSA